MSWILRLAFQPKLPLKFAEHQVVLPVIVITELERNVNDPNWGTLRKGLATVDDACVLIYGSVVSPCRWGTRGGVRAQPRRYRASFPVGAVWATTTRGILSVAANGRGGRDRYGGFQTRRCESSVFRLACADVYRNALS